MAKKHRTRNREKRPWNRPKPAPKRPTLAVPRTDAELVAALFGGPPLPGYALEAHRVHGGRDGAIVVATIAAPDGSRRVRVTLVRALDGCVRRSPIGRPYTVEDAEPREHMPDAADLGRDGGRRGNGWRTA